MDGVLDFSIGLTEGVAWPWPIAVYLFLAGISGGALGVILSMTKLRGTSREDSPLLKSAALIALATILLGMVCLVLDLTDPLFFWRILVFYNPTSVMSVGVMMLLCYIPLTAVLTKVVRSSLIDSYNQEFVKVAYARGISTVAIYFKYALRNSLIPVLISLGTQLGFLVGSIVVVEYVFNFPGIGYTVLNAILRRDNNLVQGIIILFSVFFIVLNIAIDLGSIRLDPLMRKAQGGL